MSETDIVEEEQVPNPYNMKKSWHKGQDKPAPKANELYYDDEDSSSSPQATRKVKSAPEDDLPTTHNWKKRYDDLRRKRQSETDEFNKVISDYEEKLKALEPKYEAPKSQEELQEFREANPDLYDTVESVAHNIASEQVSSLQPRLSAIEQREQQLAIREAEQAMKEKHPDYEDIRGSDEFHEWAKEQPEQIQDWIYRNPDNIELASKAISFYKLETGKGQSSRKRSPSKPKPSEMSAADMVSTKTTNVEPKQPKIWTEDEIAKMSLDQFDKYEDEIKLAHAEGRIRRS